MVVGKESRAMGSRAEALASGLGVLERIVRIGVGFLLLSLIARQIGAEQFGNWSWAIALAGMVAPFATLGLEGVVARECMRHPEEADSVVASAVLLRVAGAIFSVIVGATIWWFGDRDVSFTLVFLALCLNLFSFQDVLEMRLQADGNMPHGSLARIVAVVPAILLRIAFLIFELPVEYFAGAVLLESVFLSLALMYALRRTGARLARTTKAKCVAMLRQGQGFLYASIFTMLYLRFTQMILARHVDKAEFGSYAMAYRISEVLSVVPAILIQAQLRRIHSGVRAGYDEPQLLIYFSRIFWACFACVALFGGTGAYWVGPLLGDSYAKIHGILFVQILCVLPMGMGMARTAVFSIENTPQQYLLSVLIGAIFSITLSFLFLPAHGIDAMAWINLLSFSIAACLSGFLIPGQRRITSLMVRSPLVPFWKNT